MVDFIPYEYRQIVFWIFRIAILLALCHTLYAVLDYFLKYRILQRAALDAFNKMSLNDK